MRKRIWRLAEDQFDKEKFSLVCEPSEIVSEAAEGKEIRGSFTIKGNTDEKIRGLVYSTNPYVVCENPKFDNISHTLNYSIKLLGTKPGETLEGEFVVIAQGAQTKVPFLFEYVKKELRASDGVIHNLNDYTELAKNHWQEAVGLFFADGFEEILDGESEETKLLYLGYRRGIASSKNLEEFLIAAGKKNRVHLFISDETKSHEQVRDDIRDSIIVRKDGWGYFEIKAESDGDFLTVESPVAGSEAFLGEEFKISYYVHADKLHQGKNLGKITLTSMGNTWEIPVEASKTSLAAKGTDAGQYRKRLLLKLYQDYTDYRLKRLDVSKWAKETDRCLNELRMMDEEHALLYQLIRAYAYALDQNFQKAQEIISVLEDIIDENEQERCFLKYIQYLMTKDTEIRRQIAEEIRDMSDPVTMQYLFDWVLLQLQRDGGSERGYYYQAMSALQSTWNSPLFYIEMHEMLEKYPYLFTELNGLSLGYLSWMKKHKCFPKDLAGQLARVTDTQKNFHPQLYRILCSCYEQYPSRELLSAITRYLLSNQCMQCKYHHWYALAIREEITITGVYEAYLISRPAEDKSPLPELLTRFFVYASHLSSGRRALLYASVIRNKDNDTAMYKKYQPMIDRFAYEMIMQGRIDENMAVVFSDYLERNEITEEIAAAMAPLLFICKITCPSSFVMRGYMYHKQLQEPVMAAFRQNAAYLPVYTKEHVLLLETADHSFVKDDSLVTIEPLMDRSRWLYPLYEKAPQSVGYVISDLAKKDPRDYINAKEGSKAKEDTDVNVSNTALDYMTSEKMREKIVTQMKALITSRHVAYAWKQEWLPTASAVLETEDETDIIGEFCDSETDPGRHSVYFRSYIIGNWIKRKQYHRAFMCLRGYNGLETDPKALERLLEHLITHNGLEWYDEFAVELAAWLVEQTAPAEALSKDVLSYCAVHYVGPSEIMAKVFYMLQQQNVTVPLDLEERILVQELYSNTFVPNSALIFEAYRKKNPNHRINAAYLNYWSNEAIHNNPNVPEHIYYCILEDMMGHHPMQIPAVSCQTALLKRLCETKHLTQEETAALEKLLSLAIDRNAYFCAYEKLSQSIKEKYQLYDRFFAEYCYAEERSLYAVFDGEKKPHLLMEAYPGIYTVFHVLFPGESIHYRIISEEGEQLTDGILSYRKPEEITGNGAYEMLCDIAENMNQGRFAADDIADYITQMYTAREMFPVV